MKHSDGIIGQQVVRHSGRELFIDNWHTGVLLATTLMNHRITLAGTVRANRVKNCIMPPDKNMEKEQRGPVAIKICKSGRLEIRVIK